MRKAIFPFLALTLQAQTAGPVQSMHLLTPQTGWAATQTNLFITNNAGLIWRDITPQHTRGATISAGFFLDPFHGWLVFAHDVEDTDAHRFELASTTNGGATWSRAPLTVPDPTPSRGLSATAWIDFADPRHGWLMVRQNGNTAVSIGIMIVTTNGGRTWTDYPGVPIAGPIQFSDARHGWLSGGADRELYFSRNGGHTWTLIPLPKPPHSVESFVSGWRDPILASHKEVFVPVDYQDYPTGDRAALALYRSNSQGRTWTLRELVPVASTPSPAGITISGSRVIVVAYAPIHQLSFATESRGWALSCYGDLKSTTDGGKTWRNITPGTTIYLLGRLPYY